VEAATARVVMPAWEVSTRAGCEPRVCIVSTQLKVLEWVSHWPQSRLCPVWTRTTIVHLLTVPSSGGIPPGRPCNARLNLTPPLPKA